VVLWLGLIGAGFIAYFSYDLPRTDALVGPKSTTSVSILAADGSEITNYGEVWGDLVPVERMSPVLTQAVVAIEDRRFFSHGGIDFIGLLRAAWRNVTQGRVVEGGSTITQQLAKIVFLTPERTIERKIKEALLALWLEREFTKNQILTIYLNRVYLGAGAYGVDAAARRYFGARAETLSLPQAAMIAGLLKAPSRLNPGRDVEAATQRASQVLDAMASNGYIDATSAAAAKDAPARLARALAAAPASRYFTDWVLEQVPAFVGRDHAAIRVYTTLEPSAQRAAQAAVGHAFTSSAPGQVALLALDPSGAVRAMIGGRDYAESQFNRATQALRQPGSAFKSIVYIAGLEAGITPDDIATDEPIEIDGWAPRNYSGQYQGPITIRDAFAQSVNTVAVRVGQRAGVMAMQRTARKLGITSDLPNDASLALGTGEVTLLELTSAYAVLANGGNRVIPHGIIEIRNRSGDVLYRREGSGAGKVLAAETVGGMRDLLATVVERGTGKRARLPAEYGSGFGKTGTSQEFRDAWFVGWSGDLVAGVWFGNDDAAPMDGVTGGGLPAETWRNFMAQALRR
jgi:penicillin-binding protein 1A